VAVKSAAKKSGSARKSGGRPASAKKAAAGKKPAKAMSRGKKQHHALEKQWGMPAGYCSDGKTLATLQEVVNPLTPTLSMSELTPEQRTNLVAQRIASQKDFELAMLGAGMVNKERALAEVRANSKVGKVLMLIEQRMISNLIEQAEKRVAKATKRRPTDAKKGGRKK
jgi:hypothetical protein